VFVFVSLLGGAGTRKKKRGELRNSSGPYEGMISKKGAEIG